MPSGIAARSAACSTGLIRTVGGAVTGSTVSRACSSAASAARALSLLAGTSPSPARKSPAAGAMRMVSGMPCPSSRAARASSNWADRPAPADPPGRAERPCHRGCWRPCAGRFRQLLPPAHEMVPVLAARQRGVGDHRAGLGQRDRLQVQVLSQFDHTLPLVRVGRQASTQIADGLTQAERPERHDLHAAGTAAASAEVTSTRPPGPGHRPSRSAGSDRSSSTTSQERLVSPSQLRNWAATDSQLLA